MGEAGGRLFSETGGRNNLRGQVNLLFWARENGDQHAAQTIAFLQESTVQVIVFRCQVFECHVNQFQMFRFKTKAREE